MRSGSSRRPYFSVYFRTERLLDILRRSQSKPSANSLRCEIVAYPTVEAECENHDIFFIVPQTSTSLIPGGFLEDFRGIRLVKRPFNSSLDTLHLVSFG